MTGPEATPELNFGGATGSPVTQAMLTTGARHAKRTHFFPCRPKAVSRECLLARVSHAGRSTSSAADGPSGLPANYLPEAFCAAATNSCTLTIALSVAALAHSALLGVASGY